MLVIKLFPSALYLLTLALSVLSAPVNSPKNAFLKDVEVVKRETPPLPTIDEIKQQLSVAKDTSLFYSGPGGYAGKARTWAKNNNKAYKILAQNWKSGNWQDKWQNDEAVSAKFFNLASTAMAQLSAGTVYVMLPSAPRGPIGSRVRSGIALSGPTCVWRRTRRTRTWRRSFASTPTIRTRRQSIRSHQHHQRQQRYRASAHLQMPLQHSAVSSMTSSTTSTARSCRVET